MYLTVSSVPEIEKGEENSSEWCNKTGVKAIKHNTWGFLMNLYGNCTISPCHWWCCEGTISYNCVLKLGVGRMEAIFPSEWMVETFGTDQVVSIKSRWSCQSSDLRTSKFLPPSLEGDASSSCSVALEFLGNYALSRRDQFNSSIAPRKQTSSLRLLSKFSWADYLQYIGVLNTTGNKKCISEYSGILLYPLGFERNPWLPYVRRCSSLGGCVLLI